MNMFVLFLIWRVLGLIVAFIADKIVPSSGMFQLFIKPIDLGFQLPNFIQDSANFDGINYLHIAKYGYGLYQQAFFPLFPFLIKIVSVVTNNNYFIAGILISNLSFLIGIFVFKKYLESIGKKPKEIVWIFIFLLTFPTAFFFGAVYTESLFFLLSVLALYFMQKRKYWIVLVVCMLAALTRLIGVFLLIPLFFTVIIQQQQLHSFWKSGNLCYANLKHLIFVHGKAIALMTAPILGLLIYMFYLAYAVRNPFAFYSTQSNFHAGRSASSLIFLPQVYYRYLNIFIHAQHNLIYFVAILEFLIFNLVLVVLLYDLWILWKRKDIVNRISLIGLNIFSLINILLPTLTGTLSSVPRYTLLSLSFFIRLAEFKNKVVRSALVILFVTLFVILFVLFTQGYFVS